MKIFRYRAVGRTYEEHRGEIEAEGLDKAASALKNSGLFPHSLRTDPAPSARPSPDEEFAVFNRALAGLVKLGVPLAGSLRTLSRSAGRTLFRQKVSEVADSIEKGTPLDEALEKKERFFPKLYVQLIHAGLATGNLSASLTAIADDVEERLALRRLVWSELAYPLLVLALAAVVFGALSVWTLPELARAVRAFEIEIPTFHSYLMANVRMAGTGILILLLVFFLLRRTRFAGFAEPGLHLTGRLFRSLALTRFYTCLTTLLKNGRFDPSFLTASAQASGSRRLASSVARAAEEGWEGVPASEIIRKAGGVGAGDADILAFAEKTGTFPQAVRDLADLHREEFKSAVALLGGILPVAFTLVIGTVLGIIYISIMSPYVDFLQKVGP